MRLERLDILRGIAIVLMVVFHLNYSLVNIFSIEILNFSTDFWDIMGKVAALLFMLIAGFSFFLSEKKNPEKNVRKYIIYSMMLGTIAGWISFFTYKFFPTEYIRFGILHFFSVWFLLLIFLRKFGYYNIALWILIIIYGAYFIPVIESQYWYFLWFQYIGFSSADYYPIIPYVWVLLFWYSLWKILSHYEWNSILKIERRLHKWEIFLSGIWKKSLIIYLIHQPIIIWSLYILWIWNK